MPSAKISLQPGQWAVSPLATTALTCPLGAVSCAGTFPPNATASTPAQCLAGYQSPLCNACSAGFFYDAVQRVCLSVTAPGGGNPWLWWILLTLPLAVAAPVALCVYLRRGGAAGPLSLPLRCLRRLCCCCGSSTPSPDGDATHPPDPADSLSARAARVRRVFALVAHLKPVVACLQLCAALPAGLGFVLPPLTTQILRAWSRLSLLTLRDLPVTPPTAAATAPAAPSAFYLVLHVATLLPAAAFLLVVAAWMVETWYDRRRAAAAAALVGTDGHVATTDLLPPTPHHWAARPAGYPRSVGPLHRAAAANPRGTAYATLLHLLVYLATAGVVAVGAAALGPCTDADPDRVATTTGLLVFGQDASIACTASAASAYAPMRAWAATALAAGLLAVAWTWMGLLAHRRFAVVHLHTVAAWDVKVNTAKGSGAGGTRRGGAAEELEEGRYRGDGDGDGDGDGAHLFGEGGAGVAGGLEHHYLGGSPAATHAVAAPAVPRRRVAFALPVPWPFSSPQPAPRPDGVGAVTTTQANDEAPYIDADTAAAAAALPPLAAGGLLFLCEGYRPQCWWWDAVETCRRVLMVAALPAVNRGTTPLGGALVALFLALLFALAHSWVRPQRQVSAFVLATVANYAYVALALLAAVWLATGALPVDAASAAVALLAPAACAAWAVAAWWGYWAGGAADDDTAGETDDRFEDKPAPPHSSGSGSGGGESKSEVDMPVFDRDLPWSLPHGPASGPAPLGTTTAPRPLDPALHLHAPPPPTVGPPASPPYRFVYPTDDPAAPGMHGNHPSDTPQAPPAPPPSSYTPPPRASPKQGPVAVRGRSAPPAGSVTLSRFFDLDVFLTEETNDEDHEDGAGPGPGLPAAAAAAPRRMSIARGPESPRPASKAPRPWYHGTVATPRGGPPRTPAAAAAAPAAVGARGDARVVFDSSHAPPPPPPRRAATPAATRMPPPTQRPRAHSSPIRVSSSSSGGGGGVVLDDFYADSDGGERGGRGDGEEGDGGEWSGSEASSCLRGDFRALAKTRGDSYWHSLAQALMAADQADADADAHADAAGGGQRGAGQEAGSGAGDVPPPPPPPPPRTPKPVPARSTAAAAAAATASAWRPSPADVEKEDDSWTTGSTTGSETESTGGAAAGAASPGAQRRHLREQRQQRRAAALLHGLRTGQVAFATGGPAIGDE